MPFSMHTCTYLKKREFKNPRIMMPTNIIETIVQILFIDIFFINTGPPNPPRSVRVTVSSSQSAELRWIADKGVNQHFVSAYHVLNRKVFHYNSPESDINGTYYQKLGDLEEGTDYEALVFARNDAGDSRKVFVKFKTPGW